MFYIKITYRSFLNEFLGIELSVVRLLTKIFSSKITVKNGFVKFRGTHVNSSKSQIGPKTNSDQKSHFISKTDHFDLTTLLTQKKIFDLET